MKFEVSVKVAVLGFEEYVECLTVLAGDVLKGEAQIVPRSMLKNNGKVLRGLEVRSNNSNINPVLYPEVMYLRQKKTGATMEQAVEEFLESYNSSKRESVSDKIMEWKRVKNRITYKVINADWNEQLLKEFSHVRFLDLAIVYHVILEISDGTVASIPIRKEYLEYWGISGETLWNIAKANADKLFPAKFMSVYEKMLELLKGDTACDLLLGEKIAEDDILYVLTNEYSVYGASALFYDGILERIGQFLKGDFYVIPSSLHEVIIAKDTGEKSKEEITEMIRETNAMVVDPEEHLSDHCYYYSIATKQLSI